MKKIELVYLALRNFKGIVERVYNFGGKSTNIFGANKLGKSTSNTGFLWLLTGKDEFDRKDYEIKNTVRRELNSQPHEVEGVLRVDGQEIKLKRVYLEKWTKPKGQSQKVFDGHTVDYWIDDVPVKPAEYQARVDELIPSKYIKLISNPHFFNTLEWKKQREGLISIAGEITNDEVLKKIITPKNDFAALIKVLTAKKPLDRYRSELGEKRKLLLEKAEQYGPRIDEAKRNMPEAKDWPVIEGEIAATKKAIQEIDNILQSPVAGADENQKLIASKIKDGYGKRQDLSSLRFNIKSDCQSARDKSASEIKNVETRINQLRTDISTLQKQDNDRLTDKATYEGRIAEKNLLITACRTEWDKINKEVFVFDQTKCECPTCKQRLPEDKIASEEETLRGNFNTNVAKRKQEQVAKSDQLKKEVDDLRKYIADIDAQSNSAAQVEAKQKEIDALDAEVKKMKEAATKFSTVGIETEVDELMAKTTEAIELQKEIDALDAEVKKLNLVQSQATGNEDKKAEKEVLQNKLETLQLQLGEKKTIENSEARIKELEAEDKANAQEIATVEQLEFEVEAFVRAQMGMLEERVNKMFKYVKFRLFDTQVNGEVVEACVCELDGVPYPTLNTAAKLLAGIDCLETFSKAYGYRAPVFVDNRESTTWLPDIDSQLINLHVSAADSELRIEAA